MIKVLIWMNKSKAFPFVNKPEIGTLNIGTNRVESKTVRLYELWVSHSSVLQCTHGIDLHVVSTCWFQHRNAPKPKLCVAFD